MGKFAEKLASATPARQRAMLGNIHTLVESGKLEKYYKLLTNFDFLVAKVQHPDFGVQGLIEDYDLVEDNNEKVKTLKLIQGALRLSAHILVKDTKQLAGQLSARLLSFDLPEIKELLQQVSEVKNTCLLSLTPSLSSPTGKLISTISGHLDSVNAVAVTPDGKFVVSGSSDNTVKKWNLNTAREVLTFRGHTSSVIAVAVTPDGKKVVSGASDNTVRVWNLETGAEILTFNGHNSPIDTLAVTPDGKEVVSVSNLRINSIKVWNLETRRERLTLNNFSRVRSIAITYGYQIISAGDDGVIKVWSLKDGKIISKLNNSNFRLDNNYDQAVLAIAATIDDSQLIAVCSNNYSMGWKSGRKHLSRKLKDQTESIVDLALTPDGKQFISASLDKTLKLRDTKSGKTLSTFIGHSDSISAVTITPDCKRFISASKDKTLKVWNLDSEVIDDKKSVNDVTITPDGKLAVFGLKNNIVMAHNLENTRLTYRFTTDKNQSRIHIIKNLFIAIIEMFFLRYNQISIAILSIAFVYYVFSVAEKFENIVQFFASIIIAVFILLWVLGLLLEMYSSNNNIQSKNNTRYTKHSDIRKSSHKKEKVIPRSEEKKEILAIAVISARNWLVSVNNMMWGSHFLTIWDLKNKNYLFDLRTPSQFYYLVLSILIPIISVSFLFIYGENIYLYFLSLSLLSQGICLFGICVIYIILFAIVLLFNESPTAISITSNGKYLISGSTKGTINIWNLQKKKLLFVLEGHQQKVNALAITAHGKYLISGSDDKTIKIWNLKTRKELFTLTGHGDSVNTISVTPDGKHLVSGSNDKTIKIWNLKNRKEMFTFTGHTDSVNSVKVTSDGQLVVSASSDKTIQVWNFETRKVIYKFTGESEINCCAVAPDNITIVAGEEAGNIHFLRLQDFQVST